MDTTVSVSVTDTVSVINNTDDASKHNENTVNDTAKASKRKYGEYKHVMLKDEELQALQKDYPNWQDLIKYLDEYIEMKGYTAKSHYLCIKKWVVDAVKEKALKAGKSPPKQDNRFLGDTNMAQYGDLSQYYCNV